MKSTRMIELRTMIPAPASSAGVSGNTLATRRPFGTSVTVSPTPENRPEVADRKSASADRAVK